MTLKGNAMSTPTDTISNLTNSLKDLQGVAREFTAHPDLRNAAILTATALLVAAEVLTRAEEKLDTPYTAAINQLCHGALKLLDEAEVK